MVKCTLKGHKCPGLAGTSLSVKSKKITALNPHSCLGMNVVSKIITGKKMIFLLKEL